MGKYKYLIILVALFLGFRLLWLPENLFFGFEQGRDFLKLSEIASGNPTLIGPKTDIDGLFHGAFSYYSLLPSFVLFGGNPYLVLLSLIFVHVVSMVFLFKLAQGIKDGKFAYLVVFLYAISYASAVYARWLSNPNLVPALAIFFLYFLKLTEKKKYFLALAAVCWALVFHLQVVASLVLLLPGAYFIITKKLMTRKNVVLSVLVILAILSSYLVFNFKHDNILFDGLNSFISAKGSEVSVVRLDEFYNELVDNLFPLNRQIAFLLFWLVIIVNIIVAKRDFPSRYMLTLYFSAPLLFVLLGVSPLRHLFILSPLFLSLLIANAGMALLERKQAIAAILILFVIIAGNIAAVLERFPESNRNFIYHAQRTYLGNMKSSLDYVYTDVAGGRFSYDYYSVPYWHNEAWEYMFAWYGKWQYGYLPEPNRTKVHYVLIEPDEGQPEYQKNWYNGMSLRSKLLEEHESGKLKVEKREEI